MEKAVKRIRPVDFELSQVQDNLAECIQQLLDSLNGTAAAQFILSPLLEQLRGAGTPYSVKTPALQVKGRKDGQTQPGQPTVVIGDPSSTSNNGVVSPQKDAFTTHYGKVVFVGSPYTDDGVVIVPQVAGTIIRIPTLDGVGTTFFMLADGTTYLRGSFSNNGPVNLGGDTAITGTLNVGQTVTSPNFNSFAGFKNTVCCGTWWNTQYQANTLVQLQVAVVNQAALGGPGNTPFCMKFTHNGSIVGMTLNQAGPNPTPHTLFIYKNGVLSYTWLAGSGGANATFWAQFPKGTAGLTFLAGDTLTTFYRTTGNGNVQILAHLTIEMVA